jgi:hypothetical protein
MMERRAYLDESLAPCSRARPGERRENFTTLHRTMRNALRSLLSAV